MIFKRTKLPRRFLVSYFSLIALLALLAIPTLVLVKDQLIEELNYHNTGLSTYNSNFFKLTRSLINQGLKEEPTLTIDVNFASLEILKKDRVTAVSRGILFDAKEVPARVSFGGEVFPARISLKGDLPDHWSSERGMSLKIKLRDGFVLGFKRFSIQKPATRQYPSNDLFLSFSKEVGVSSNHMTYVPIVFNGQKWGKMNLEPVIDKNVLETEGKRESLTLKFDDQKEWNYRILAKKNGTYNPHYKAFDMLFDANFMQENRFMSSKRMRAQYSYLIQNLRNHDPKILFEDNFCKAIVLGEIWNTMHALAISNSRYYFNPFRLKIEPILSDQASITLRDNLKASGP